MRVFFSDEFRRLGLTFGPPAPGDAGYDLCAAEALTLAPGTYALVRTGLFLEIPPGYVGLIKDRSSMALAGIHTMAGVIDSSYRGELKILLLNVKTTNYDIEVGRKIAQMVVVPYHVEPIEVVERLENLSPSSRGADGFGSTGKYGSKPGSE